MGNACCRGERDESTRAVKLNNTLADYQKSHPLVYEYFCAEYITADIFDSPPAKWRFRPRGKLGQVKPALTNGATDGVTDAPLDEISTDTKTEDDEDVPTISDWLVGRLCDHFADPRPKEYDYVPYDGFPDLPRHVVNIPWIERFKNERIFDLISASIKTAVKFDDFEKKKTECDTVDEFYEQMYHDLDFGSLVKMAFGLSLERTQFEKSWKQDECFAANFIAGISPVFITRVGDVQTIIDALHLDDDKIRRIDGLLDARGQDVSGVQGLIDTGRLFYVTYPNLTKYWDTQIDSATGDGPLGHCLYPCSVLFYVEHRDGEPRCLMPLAIDLGRQNEAHHPEKQFYMPSDPPLVWRFAKMCAACTDAQAHEARTHLGYTHVAMEPIIIAFHVTSMKVSNTYTPTHPLFRLMKPFFWNTLAINNIARFTLIAPEGLLDDIMSITVLGALKYVEHEFKRHWRLDRTFIDSMTERGFGFDDDPDVDAEDDEKSPLLPGDDRPAYAPTAGADIPGHHYKTDGHALWHIYRRFIRSCVFDNVYASDADMLKDPFFTTLMSELRDADKGAVKGVPDVQTRTQLVDMLTTVMFTVSAQHAAVNYGQYIFYGYCPNRPGLLTSWMPEDPDEVDEQFLLHALPTVPVFQQTVAVLATLSLPSNHALLTHSHMPIAKQMNGLEMDKLFKSQFNAMNEELTRQDEFIDRRSKFPQPGLELDEFPHYQWLEPDRVPASIAI